MKATEFWKFCSNQVNIPTKENTNEQSLLLCQLSDRSFYTDINNRPICDRYPTSHIRLYGDNNKPVSTALF